MRRHARLPSRARRLTRRQVLRGLGGALGSLAVRPILSYAAATEPSCPELVGKRIRWLVGWSPGGGYDVYSRLLEPTLEEVLRTQVVVENIPGAAGLLAARRLMSAAPDGRTLGILNGTGLMLAPLLNLPITPELEADFTVLGRIVPHRPALVVGASSGLEPLRAFVESGKRRTLVLGTTGLATVNTLLTALLRPLFGVEVVLIAGYPGSRQLLTAIVRKEIDDALMSIETPRRVEGVVPVLRFEHDTGTDPWIANVPALSGPNSIRTLDPELFVDDGHQVESLVPDLVSLMEVGRLVAGPPGLSRELRGCLRDAVDASLAHPRFLASAERANRSVSAASHADVMQRVEAARRATPRYADLMRELLRESNRSR